MPFCGRERIGFETGARSETRIGFSGVAGCRSVKFIGSPLQQTADAILNGFCCAGCWQDSIDASPRSRTCRTHIPRTAALLAVPTSALALGNLNVLCASLGHMPHLCPTCLPFVSSGCSGCSRLHETLLVAPD